MTLNQRTIAEIKSYSSPKPQVFTVMRGTLILLGNTEEETKVNKHFPEQNVVFTCLQYKSFENTVGKEEIACKEQFLLFPTVFSTGVETFLPFSSNLELSSANSFSLEE